MGRYLRIKSFCFTVLFVVGFSAVFGQSKSLDRLEQYYDQGHYKLVFRKSLRLMKSQENNSILPAYYRAMSSFQLMHNQKWYDKNSSELKESRRLMDQIFTTEEWSILKKSHFNELLAMEALFELWMSKTAPLENEIDNDLMRNWIVTHFYLQDVSNPFVDQTESNELIPEGLSVAERNTLIHYAYEFMGIEYKWGGADQNGFDCSGFTSHVFKRLQIQLPRISGEQYTFAKKIHPKRAYMGDLVFFAEADKITHVGILVNQLNESKKMIHSSSSKGISVADIEASEYWKKRIVAYGRIIR